MSHIIHNNSRNTIIIIYGTVLFIITIILILHGSTYEKDYLYISYDGSWSSFVDLSFPVLHEKHYHYHYLDLHWFYIIKTKNNKIHWRGTGSFLVFFFILSWSWSISFRLSRSFSWWTMGYGNNPKKYDLSFLLELTIPLYYEYITINLPTIHQQSLHRLFLCLVHSSMNTTNKPYFNIHCKCCV